MIALRLALFYVVCFLPIGIQMPFWPVWLAFRGMGPAEIGILLAATNVTRIFAGPAFAPFADRAGRRKQFIVGTAAGALAAYLLFSFAEGFWPLLAVTVLAALFSAAMFPLAESLTVLAVRTHGLNYGRVRLWGSVSFMATAILVGRALGAGVGEGLILTLMIGAFALTTAGSLGLPDMRTPPAQGAHAPLRLLLGSRPFALFLIAASLLQASHAVYYGFSTLHWRSVGHPDEWIGAFWAEGVVAEIVLFAVAAQVAQRLGPARLLLLAAAGGVVRWVVLGATDQWAAIVVVQALHAATFGATHVAAMHFIARAVPPDMVTTAQSLYFSLAAGGATALFMVASGWLYEAFGPHAYFAMALASAAGGAVALVLARLWREGVSLDGSTPGPGV
jgi:PPP family 3-phenylpropionic acid transporter